MAGNANHWFIGREFGWLTPVRVGPRLHGRRALWCGCRCGAWVLARADKLEGGWRKSCAGATCGYRVMTAARRPMPRGVVRARRRLVWVEWEGARVPLFELCARLGVSRGLVYGRLGMGWPLGEALGRPVRPIRRRFRGAGVTEEVWP